MKYRWIVPLMAFFIVTAVWGCAPKNELEQSPKRVQKNASKMTLAELEAKAKYYEDAILAQKKEFDKLVAEVNKFPPSEVYGDKTKGLREQITKIQKAATPFIQRYRIYAAEILKKGGTIDANKYA